MPLTARDLEQIRRIVREELVRLNSRPTAVDDSEIEQQRALSEAERNGRETMRRLMATPLPAPRSRRR